MENEKLSEEQARKSALEDATAGIGVPARWRRSDEDLQLLRSIRRDIDQAGRPPADNSMNIDLKLPLSIPSEKGVREKRVVIGCFPYFGAEGEKFLKAHVRFDDGALLHYICDALIYTGDELSIGGRKYVRKPGEEFWIVRFRTEEDPGDGV